MKKIFLSVAIIFTALASGYAQNGGAFEKGDKLLNAGIGLGTYYGYNSAVPIGASFEYGVSNFISVGGQIDFYTSKFGNYKWTYVPFAARASYHFGKHFLEVDNLDLYGGVALGYFISSDNNDFNDADYGSKALFDIYAGARYYFKPNFGVFGEAGAGVSALKLGVTFKF